MFTFDWFFGVGVDGVCIISMYVSNITLLYSIVVYYLVAVWIPR